LSIAVLAALEAGDGDAPVLAEALPPLLLLLVLLLLEHPAARSKMASPATLALPRNVLGLTDIAPFRSNCLMNTA
jgi:hypothetical protein